MALPIAIAGADQTVLQSALPVVAGLTFDGSASTPGTGGTSIVAYQWSIVELPAGSAAVLTGSTTATPTLAPIDTWQNIRLKLRVQDDTGAWSEGVDVLAPDSAFVTVRVTSANATLEKMSKGERTWQARAREWVDEIDSLRTDLTNQTIADHDTTATGADLDTLTDGSNATGLHIHDGGDVAVATTTTQGTVKLAEAPLDPANPKALTKAHAPFTGTCDGTLLATGWAPVLGLIDTTGNWSQAHIAWLVHEALTVTEFTVALRNGGAAGAGGYVVRLYKMTQAQYLANDFAGATVLATVTLAAPASNYAPKVGAVAAFSTAVALGDMLAVKITTAPTLLANMGAGLNVVVGWRKEF